MSHMTVRARLILLVTLMSLAMIIIGAVGIYTAKSEEQKIDHLYNQVVLPMREIARIRRLTLENAGQFFRAFQHNPAIDYVKLHDHPVTEHTEAIESNLKRMQDTFAHLHEKLDGHSEEAKRLSEIEQLYAQYTQQAVQPTLAALKAGDYSTEAVGRFLKNNRQFEKSMNPKMGEFVQLHEERAKSAHEQAIRDTELAIKESLLLIVFGVGVGVALSIVTIRSITRPLQDIRDIMHRAAHDRDFTGQVTIQHQDEIGQTATSFNTLMSTLRSTLGEIKNNTQQVDAATAALATAAQQASIASNETSESASSMAASVEEMSVSITSVSDSTREALVIARDAGEHSESGGAVIAGTVRDMTQIAEQVRGVGANITELGDHSNKISTVVQVIKDVADQTNLLALNAAIEAARAGEAGRGFAVVADEVRKLAERTTLATGEIAHMISAIQSSAHTAVHAMNGTIDSLQRGTEQAAKAGEAIVAIQESNNRVVEVVRSINDAMGEQGAASQDIAQRVERVAQASEESSSSVSASAENAHHIHQLALAMRQNVERFRI